MKPLIAVVSCHSRPEYADAQRSTWAAQTYGVDCRFFLGRGANSPRSNEVLLDVHDDHQSLLLKVREIIRWARTHEYDAVLKCDDDTLVSPQNLLEHTEEFGEYCGEVHELNGIDKYFAAGGGYWLSSRAMDILLNSNESQRYWERHQCLENPFKLLPEDRWVSQVLHAAGIKPKRMDALFCEKSRKTAQSVVSWEYSPQELIAEYQGN